MVYGLFFRNFLRILPLSVERFRLVCIEDCTGCQKCFLDMITLGNLAY